MTALVATSFAWNVSAAASSVEEDSAAAVSAEKSDITISDFARDIQL